MIMKQNGYDTSGYYDKVSKIGKAMTTLSRNQMDWNFARNASKWNK